MNRRQLLKLLALGVAGHTLDIDRLLWVPGSKTIFIPSPSISLGEIVALEFERIIPHLRNLFERDDTFYRLLRTECVQINASPLKIPLQLKPGGGKGN